MKTPPREDAAALDALRSLEGRIGNAFCLAMIAMDRVDNALQQSAMLPKHEDHTSILLSDEEVDCIAFITGEAARSVRSLRDAFYAAIEGRA